MDTPNLTQSPFAILTFIVAPALLTNASSVLAMSTINRMLRTRDRMEELYAKSEPALLPEPDSVRLVAHVDRVEKQAAQLVRALRAIYVALGSFVAATLITLAGAALASFPGMLVFRALAVAGLTLGIVGVSGLIVGCVNLFRATQISLINLSEEATLIRQRQAQRRRDMAG